ncbi:bifunctional (p)ppGpp synthetase/guanosine-3',5'-bis(diphosphate) 3'-pyrophosphohydrolase [Bartonella sp. DGB1]|uniref:RelA/SpoT family protein n=1 Tax=Bartonella sp. DGB1 TaxID=3239807 RepID=UPI003524BE65
MMSCCELIAKVKSYKTDVNEELLRKAYEFGLRKHGAQKRASGLPYFSHPVEVANIITDMRLDEKTIAVALLHDTLEDTSATKAELNLLFGKEIGRLVEGVTKLQKLDFISHKIAQAENLRKLLLAVCDDVRVLLVKFADRLHNMRTLDVVRLDKRLRISEETLDIYAPLAGRMGMQDLREELEEISFRYVNPEAWQLIQDKLAMMTYKNQNLIYEIEHSLAVELKKAGIEAVVYGRKKAAWSIFRKMQRKALSFEQLSDIYGFRAIVKNKEDCYKTLGVIHVNWSVVPGRFKDYISTPKQNGYQSIHTTIVGPSRQRIELQIRTNLMHEIAEYGVAAHAFYKDASLQERANADLSPFSKNDEKGLYNWLRLTIQSLSDGAHPEEFLENTKLELFQDQVFCFTPRGRLISLPYGAKPLDFAYAVHTQIGNHCSGVKINGCVMSLASDLCNGDEVEILCSPSVVPSPSWEALATTGKARAAIRRASKAAARRQYEALGTQLLEKKFSEAEKIFSRESLGLILARLDKQNIEDLIISVGCGEITPVDVLKALYPNYKEERYYASKVKNNLSLTDVTERQNDDKSKLSVNFYEKDNLNSKTNKILAIKGHNKDLPVKFGVGGAVPGDRIVGILEPGVGIIIYPIQSTALTKYENDLERWVDVRWDLSKDSEDRFAAVIRIIVADNVGLLSQLSTIIFEHDVDIKNIVLNKLAEDFYEIFIELKVWNLANLNTLISRLKIVESVREVIRVFDEIPFKK